MANTVFELVDMLYNMVADAWGVPLGSEKCVIKRDEALDLLDEIKSQLPVEIGEAKRLMNARAEYIANAKSEAETIRRNAEEQARRLVDEQVIVRTARAKGNEIIMQAEERAKELRRMANAYADDVLHRTEETIGEALNGVRQSRISFRQVTAKQSAAEQPAETAAETQE